MLSNALILGCGRSGTSIFGELFETFPRYRYASEPNLADIATPRAGERMAVKVPRVPDGTSLPSGCAVEVADVERVLSPLVVFWQVRHPLDAICSLRVGIGDGWGHHPRPLDWQDWLDRPLIEQCAHHWAVINSTGFDQVRDVAVVNRFEEMIDDPRTCGLAAARAVGLSDSDLGDDFDAWVDRVQDTNNSRFVEAITSRRNSRPDHARRVGRWTENLSAAEAETAWAIVAPTAATFGYELR